MDIFEGCYSVPLTKWNGNICSFWTNSAPFLWETEEHMVLRLTVQIHILPSPSLSGCLTLGTSPGLSVSSFFISKMGK